MPQTTTHKNPLHLLAASAMLVSFFLPWVKWEEYKMSGLELPIGHFFATSADKFGLANPYPQFNFTFYLFLLIPVLTIVAAFLHVKGKKASWIAAIAGSLSLTLVTMYAIFTHTLLDLGVGKSLAGMIQPFLYIQAAAALLFIWTSRPDGILLKAFLILIGPIIAYGGYSFVKYQVENETFSSTTKEKPAYTVNAAELIQEFISSDSTANKKYTDKIIVVNGRISELEAADSTINVKFTDSTSGSYAIFDFQAADVAAVKKLNVGDSISIKASCSGGIFSRLRQATVINFKRSAINKQ
jgi:hypothetical protein